MANYTNTKKDVYQIVTDRIIADLEKGIIPWRKPWNASNAATVWTAHSRSTGKNYSLINQMLLGGDGEYATFKEITAEGGRVKRGAKAKYVVFWKQLMVEQKNDDGTPVLGENGKPEVKKIPYLKYYTVFQVGVDTEGLDIKYQNPTAEPVKPTDAVNGALAIAHAYCDAYKIKLNITATDSAYYQPATEYIQVPQLAQYSPDDDGAAEFLSTLYHELAHSTGKRLERDLSGSFGSQKYAREELTAEISSAFSLAQLGLDTSKSNKNSTAYIQDWLQALKNDKKLVVIAAGKAEKATELILQYQPVDPTPEQPDSKPVESKPEVTEPTPKGVDCGEVEIVTEWAKPIASPVSPDAEKLFSDKLPKAVQRNIINYLKKADKYSASLNNFFVDNDKRIFITNGFSLVYLENEIFNKIPKLESRDFGKALESDAAVRYKLSLKKIKEIYKNYKAATKAKDGVILIHNTLLDIDNLISTVSCISSDIFEISLPESKRQVAKLSGEYATAAVLGKNYSDINNIQAVAKIA